MISPIIIVAIIITTALLLMRLFRKQLRNKLLYWRQRLKVRSLRAAIKKANKIKDETNRKAIVVMNLGSGEYEAVTKKDLKQVSEIGKNKSNKAMTEGRKKYMKKRKPGRITAARVKQIEKKSLYVTN